jgi:hypothetical protein
LIKIRIIKIKAKQIRKKYCKEKKEAERTKSSPGLPGYENLSFLGGFY